MLANQKETFIFTKKNFMNKLLILTVLLSFLFACGDSSIFEDEDIECVELTGSCEKNMFGNFKAMGSLANICDDKSLTSVTIQFEFSGGNEERTFNKDLSAGHKVKRLWSTKIKGHKNEKFISMKLVSVE